VPFNGINNEYKQRCTGEDDWISIVRSKSKGQIVGKCKISCFQIMNIKEFHDLLWRHRVDMDTLKTEVCRGFTNFVKTPIFGWEFKELVVYEESRTWFYSGQLAGNPSYLKLNGLSMSLYKDPNQPESAKPQIKSTRLIGKQVPKKRLLTADEPPPTVIKKVARRPVQEKKELKEGIECKPRCSCTKCKSILVGGLTFAQRRRRTDREQKYGRNRGRPRKQKDDDKKKHEDDKHFVKGLAKPPTHEKKRKTWNRRKKPGDNPRSQVAASLLTVIVSVCCIFSIVVETCMQLHKHAHRKRALQISLCNTLSMCLYLAFLWCCC